MSEDVVIVGAGPAGAATALALARRGRRVTVVDQAVFPRDKPCGDFVQPRGAAILRDLGVADVLAGCAQPLRGMLIVSPAGRRVPVPFVSGHGLSVPRRALDDALLAAAREAGAAVRTGERVRAIVRSGAGWRVETERETLAAHILVGADGLRSRVARWTGLQPGPPGRGRYAMSFHVQGLPAFEGFGEMHLARGAYCGVSVFADGTANVTPVVPKGDLRRPGPPAGGSGDPTSVLRRLGARFPALRDRLAEASTVVPARATGPLASVPGRVTGDGVVLVGDAAAFTDPLTGQGVSLALAGADAAARAIDGALGQGDAGVRVLAPYARWHRRQYAALRAFLRAVEWFALRTPLIEHLAVVWQRHPALAARFLGVIGNGDPILRALQPSYLPRLLWACIPRS